MNIPKFILIALISGVVISTVGGLFANNLLYYGGMIVAAVAVCSIAVIGIMRDPVGVLKAEAQVEEEFSGVPPQGVRPEQIQTARSNSVLSSDVHRPPKV